MEKIEGAAFKSVDYTPPYYNTIITVDDIKPWLPEAQIQEKTFLNQMKADNEPPVKDYKELVLGPIPLPYHEAFSATENRPVKPFNSKPEGYSYMTVFLVLFVILFLIYKFMK